MIKLSLNAFWSLILGVGSLTMVSIVHASVEDDCANIESEFMVPICERVISQYNETQDSDKFKPPSPIVNTQAGVDFSSGDLDFDPGDVGGSSGGGFGFY